MISSQKWTCAPFSLKGWKDGRQAWCLTSLNGWSVSFLNFHNTAINKGVSGIMKFDSNRNCFSEAAFRHGRGKVGWRHGKSDRVALGWLLRHIKNYMNDFFSTSKNKFLFSSGGGLLNSVHPGSDLQPVDLVQRGQEQVPPLHHPLCHGYTRPEVCPWITCQEI